MTIDLKSLTHRVEKLEKAVFGDKAEERKSETPSKGFSGATGGVRFLVVKGFFNAKRGLSDVKSELSEKGYHYSIHAVQMALSRLSKAGGALVAMKEGGKKKYAKRK